MLRLESQREGFVLYWKDEPLLQHSRSLPCVRLSELPPVEWSDQGRGGGHWVRRAFRSHTRLREYRILENDPGRVVLNFGGSLGLEISADDHRAVANFVATEEPAGLRIEFACKSGEAIFGGGADSAAPVDLARSRIEAWGGETSHGGVEGLVHKALKGRDWPIMSFITASRRWYRIEGLGWMAADFRQKGRLGFEFSTFPSSIVIGAEESMSSALGGLSRRSGLGLVPPAWSREGPIVATSEAAGGLQDLIDRLRASGIKASGFRLLDLDVLDPASSGDARIGILRKNGLKVLGVARPGGGTARLLDALAEGGSLPETAIVIDSGIDGVRTEQGGFLGLPDGNEGDPRPDRIVSRRASLLSRALREALVSARPPHTEGGAGEDRFLLTSDRGWGMEALMHCCALPALVDDVADIPRRCSALHAQGLSGGGWTWFDAACAWAGPSAGRRASAGRLASAGRRPSATAGLARRRMIELAAFGPVFEFAFPAQGGPEAEESLRLLSRMSLVFSLLRPYHEAVAGAYPDEPLPPIRHSFVHYDDRVATRRLDTQYFYGRDLLAAVSGDRGEFVSLELPDEEWVHLWSSRRFRGGPVSIEASPGQPAVFYRASSAFASLFDSIRLEARRK